jgi:Tfp pilus assembly protein PilV
MNTKGQSLIAVLVSVGLMGIVLQGMMSIFALSARQQATVQRRAAWTTTQANVTQNLLNLAACSQTVQALANPSNPPLPGILLSNGAKLLSVGEQLAPGFNVTTITLTPVGSPVTQSTTTTTASTTPARTDGNGNGNDPCTNGGNDVNNKGVTNTVVTTTVSTQQAQIGVTAQYVPMHRNYVANYVVNLTLTNGVVTGCQ